MSNMNNISQQYLKKTEQLLYLYPKLKLNIKQSKKEIALLKKGLLQPPERSKSVVFYAQSASKVCRDDVRERYILGREATLHKTLFDVIRIEEALQLTNGHRGHPMLALKYFKQEGYLPDEDVMERLNISRSTYYRWRIEILSIISQMLFDVSEK
ncbi:MAG: hypothetical protein H7Y41_07400 [Hyphomonadaceae bacterium]|nr:hypothetical protein [Clostridia bacterium]